MTDIEKILNKLEERIQETKDLKIDSSYNDGLIFAFEEAKDIVSSLQEEPISMWHDVSEEPKPNMELICVGQYGNPLVLSSNSNSFKERYISKWAYFNDLLNLSNVERTIKDWIEVDIDKLCEFRKNIGFAYPEGASEYQKQLACYRQGIKDAVKEQKGE